MEYFGTGLNKLTVSKQQTEGGGHLCTEGFLDKMAHLHSDNQTKRTSLSLQLKCIAQLKCRNHNNNITTKSVHSLHSVGMFQDYGVLRKSPLIKPQSTFSILKLSLKCVLFVKLFCYKYLQICNPSGGLVLVY